MKTGQLLCLLLLLTGCGPSAVEVRVEPVRLAAGDTEQLEPPPPPPPLLDSGASADSAASRFAAYNPPSVGTESDFTPLRDKAHPLAKRLMDEDFYWSPIEETAPFGSDDGAEAYAGFRDWRRTHPATAPLRFLTALISRWGYRPFDLHELNIVPLKAYLAQEEIAVMQMSGTDAAIVAIAFGQLYLEGKVDPGFNTLAQTALRRQLLPDILGLWGADYQGKRELQLRKMLAVLMEVE
ncbi:MAG: hypothetical protein EOO15_04375 [Chitinophagaceae bacterium]|nr:MAG: hypothetical protein EOO15_04375 [Chitinophagaceae bacterium]